jgi:hypothetical protein
MPVDAQCLRLLAGAGSLRLALSLLPRVTDALQWRVEVSTPSNSLLSIREGLHLLQELQLSPYAGSACRHPPLLLWLHQRTAHLLDMHMLPNLALDLVAGLALRAVAVGAGACVLNASTVQQLAAWHGMQATS